MSIMLSSCVVPFDIRKSDPENAIIPNCKARISVWCLVKGKELETIEPQQNIVSFIE